MKYQFMIDQSMSVAVFSPNGWVPGRCCLPVVNEQNGEKRHWVSVLEVDDGELLFGFLLESLMHEGIPIRLIGQVLVVETEAQVKSTQKKLREIMHIRELSSRWRDKILNLKSSAPSSKVLPPIKWCCDIADFLHQVRRRRVALNVVEGALGDIPRMAIGIWWPKSKPTAWCALIRCCVTSAKSRVW